VAERATIAFADSAADVAGVAIADAGSLLLVGGELTAAAPPALAGAEPTWTLGAAGAYELELRSRGVGVSLSGGATIWLCRATGRVEEHDLGALCTLTVETVAADFALQRSLSIPLAAELSFALLSRRRSGAVEHGEEQLEALVWRGEPAVSVALERPRLSTTYDGAGIARHAGIELWENEESEHPLRIGGEALNNGELVHPDGARSRVVFLAWHHESHRAIGSYTITTAAER